MDWTLFSALFILQFVGHRIGDYLLQTDYQAQNKTKNMKALMDHCISYALIITIISLLMVPYEWAILIFLVTFSEHMFIDTRLPVIWWKKFVEKTITGNKSFKMDTVPLFVVIEMDQTMHMIRIMLISLAYAYFN